MASEALPLDFISPALLLCDCPPYISEEPLGSAVSWPSMGRTYAVGFCSMELGLVMSEGGKAWLECWPVAKEEVSTRDGESQLGSRSRSLGDLR